MHVSCQSVVRTLLRRRTVGTEHGFFRLVDSLITCAEARQRGAKPAKKSQALVGPVQDKYGNPFLGPVDPVLVLMESAGTAPMPSTTLRTTADRIEELQEELENLRPEDPYRSELEAMLDELQAEGDDTSLEGSPAGAEMADDFVEVEPEHPSYPDRRYTFIPYKPPNGGQGDAQSSGQLDGGNKVDLLDLLTGHKQAPSGGTEPA